MITIQNFYYSLNHFESWEPKQFAHIFLLCNFIEDLFEVNFLKWRNQIFDIQNKMTQL